VNHVVGQTALARALAQVDPARVSQPEQEFLQEELADPPSDRAEALIGFWSVGGKRARLAS